MKYLAALALAAASSGAQAQHWSEGGGREHFAFSAAVGFGCASAFRESAATAFGCALVPGLLKELDDRRTPGNYFSGRDMAANALGAVVGVGLGRFMIQRYGGTTTLLYRTEF